VIARALARVVGWEVLKQIAQGNLALGPESEQKPSDVKPCKS